MNLQLHQHNVTFPNIYFISGFLFIFININMKLIDLFENVSVGGIGAGSIAALPQRFTPKKKKQNKPKKKKIKVIRRIRDEVKN